MNIDLTKYVLFSEHSASVPTLLNEQGFSNKNYRFDYQNRTYLLRKFILQDRDRELEFRIQTLAYEKGLAAKPFLLDTEHDLMICEFLEGEHKEKLSREDLTRIVQVLKELHHIHIESDTMNLVTLFHAPDKAVKEAFSTIKKYPKEIVLCHNDLNPKNILFLHKGVKLIDWEFAGNNDLYFDLAALSIEFDLDVIDEAYMLASYFLFAGWEKEKMESYKVIYKALCEQWFENHNA